jgi:hypothetical protein
MDLAYCCIIQRRDLTQSALIYDLPLNNTAGSHDSLLLYATDSVLKIGNISANLKQN